MESGEKQPEVGKMLSCPILKLPSNESTIYSQLPNNYEKKIRITDLLMFWIARHVKGLLFKALFLQEVCDAITLLLGDSR